MFDSVLNLGYDAVLNNFNFRNTLLFGYRAAACTSYTAVLPVRVSIVDTRIV